MAVAELEGWVKADMRPLEAPQYGVHPGRGGGSSPPGRYRGPEKNDERRVKSPLRSMFEIYRAGFWGRPAQIWR